MFELPELTNLIQPETLHKEGFKYNQLILKLARQFLKNILTQKVQALSDDDSGEMLQDSLNNLAPLFSDLLAQVTEKYLALEFCHIDQLLLENTILDSSQLQFIHGSAMHLEVKAMDKKFGEIAVKNRFTTQKSVNKALSEQTRHYLKTGRNNIIGNILVELEEMTPQVRDEILLLQNRLSEDNWEECLRESGRSVIEEKEKNALFGALVIKEKIMNKASVIDALKQQNFERSEYERVLKNSEHRQINRKIKEPRWIGDILVEDYGLSETDRKKIVKLQMGQRIEIINLKFGVGIKGAQKELIRAMDSIFQILYTENRLQAVLQVVKEIPETITRTNIMLWLYHKRITYGINSDAIRKLLENRIKPGEKVVIAYGTEPAAEKIISTPLFKEIQGHPYPPIVRKGDILVKLTRQQGKSGINVNNCFIVPHTSPASLTAGINIIQAKNEFLAGCDGVPMMSDKGIVTVAPVIEIPGDLNKDAPAIDHDCNVRIQGRVFPDVFIKCRHFTASEFEGKLISRGDVEIGAWAKGADIEAHGEIRLASISGCQVTGLKDVLIKSFKPEDNEAMQGVDDSVVACRRFCIVTDLEMKQSVISAGEKIIFKNVKVENNCQLVVGDTLEIFLLKNKLRKKREEIKTSLEHVKTLQEKIQSIYANINEVDFMALDRKIKDLNSMRLKTKSDMDKLSALKKKRRQMEKEKEAVYNKYGSVLISLSKKIPLAKEKHDELKKEQKALEKDIQLLYKNEKINPEIDARKAVLAGGVILQFPHASLTLDTDSTGVVFREAFDHTAQQFQVKDYKW